MKMPSASMQKCQCLTSLVNVWEGEFYMTKYVFCSVSARLCLYIELTLKYQTKGIIGGQIAENVQICLRSMRQDKTFLCYYQLPIS